jgi:hypothetical protein
MSHTMRQKLNARLSEIPLAAEYALLTVAGAMSFLAANLLGPRSSEDSTVVELRTPRSALTAHVPNADVKTGVLPAGAAAQEPSTSRLGIGMLHNPFGPLNLLASVDQPTQAGAGKEVVHSPPKPLVKKIKPKLSPEPPAVVVATAPPPPPAPVAPPLPFTVVGSIQGPLITAGAQVAFLQYRNELLVVRAGDLIGQDYRIEKIADNAVDLTYLPLKKLQRLTVPR